MTPATDIDTLRIEAEGAHERGDYLLAGALMSQVNALHDANVARLAILADESDADGNHVAAQAIRSYANEMEQGL